MIDREQIKKEADSFFEWPTANKDHITTTSALIFAEHIAKMVQMDCAELIQTACMNGDLPDCCEDSADLIMRSNALVQGEAEGRSPATEG